MYSDQKYYARVPVKVSNDLALGTATASGANTLAVTEGDIFNPFRLTKVLAIKVFVSTIADTGSTDWDVEFLNGTDTMGVVVLTTETAGTWLDATITVANSTFAADTSVTVQVTGTATASADAAGVIDVWFEVTENFV